MNMFANSVTRGAGGGRQQTPVVELQAVAGQLSGAGLQGRDAAAASELAGRDVRPEREILHPLMQAPDAIPATLRVRKLKPVDSHLAPRTCRRSRSQHLIDGRLNLLSVQM